MNGLSASLVVAGLGGAGGQGREGAEIAVGVAVVCAVADQLNLRKKLDAPIDYKAARRATAQQMRTHPDEYKPFISDSDEHMAGIINREAGTLNSEQAQESRSPPSPCSTSFTSADICFALGRVLLGLLLGGGVQRLTPGQPTAKGPR